MSNYLNSGNVYFIFFRENSYINVSFVLKYIIVRPEKGRTALYRSFFGYTYI